MHEARPRGAFAWLRRLLGDRRASIAPFLAIALPALIGIGALAMDYTSLSTQRGRLQAIADSAALAAAREFRLGNASSTTVIQAATTFANAALAAAGQSATVAPTSDATAKTVTVALSMSIASYSAAVLGGSTSQIDVKATARMVGGAPICVIAMDQSATQSLLMDKDAKLNAPNCSVYSNSKKNNGLMAKNNATMTAAFICSAGGKAGNGPGSFTPTPQIDCPALPDPLGARTLPTASGCVMTAATINGGVVNLVPGTYCNGLTITNGAMVSMSAGTYIFKNGALTVQAGGELTGVNVALHFTGNGAVVNFQALSTISLTAPRAGNMAGLLITEDRTTPANQKHQILSDNARTLLGTIYLPVSELHVGAAAPVADKSAYTIVVANTFTLSAGPTMVLNTNYTSTDVPVPAGVGPQDGKTSLVN